MMSEKLQKAGNTFLFLMINCIFLLISTTGRAQKTQKLRVDPLNASGGNISDYFDTVTYIPLETTKESLFGKIEQLAVTDDYFIILDYDTNCILIFYKNGKFHLKISGGSKNGARVGVRYFTINKEKKEISFETNDGKKMVYDFEGKKIAEERKSDLPEGYYLSQNRVIYYNVNTNDKDSSAKYELTWQQAGQTYRSAFSLANRKSNFAQGDIMSPSRSPFYDTGNDSTVVFSRPFDYNIYQLGNDTVINNYSLLLPLNISLPNDFGTKEYYGKRFTYLVREHPDLVYAISHFYRIGNLIFFKLQQNNSYSDKSFIYNLRSGNLVSLEKVQSDSTNSFLPVFTYNGSATFTFASGNFILPMVRVCIQRRHRWRCLAQKRLMRIRRLFIIRCLKTILWEQKTTIRLL